MPYIYSTHSASIRWADALYALNDGETASEIFIAPEEMTREEAAPKKETSPLFPPEPPASPFPDVSQLALRLTAVEARLDRFLKIVTAIPGSEAREQP